MIHTSGFISSKRRGYVGMAQNSKNERNTERKDHFGDYVYLHQLWRHLLKRKKMKMTPSHDNAYEQIFAQSIEGTYDTFRHG